MDQENQEDGPICRLNKLINETEVQSKKALNENYSYFIDLVEFSKTHAFGNILGHDQFIAAMKSTEFAAVFEKFSGVFTKFKELEHFKSLLLTIRDGNVK